MIKKDPVFLTLDTKSMNAIDIKNKVIGMLATVPNNVNAATAPVTKKINNATVPKIPIKIKSLAFSLLFF